MITISELTDEVQEFVLAYLVNIGTLKKNDHKAITEAQKHGQLTRPDYERIMKHYNAQRKEQPQKTHSHAGTNPASMQRQSSTNKLPKI